LIGRLVEIAAGNGGEFLVATVGSEDPKTGEKLVPLNLHVPNDEHAMEGLLKAIDIAARQRGDNCYIGIALMKPGLSTHQKGTEADVSGVLAAVTDWDGKNDPKTRLGRLPGYPHAEVETSPSNFQCWYFFDRPYPVAEAKPVLTALARCTKSDHTQSCDHVFRVPGTLNWPSRQKIAKGRSAVPWRARLTSIADPDWQSDSITLDELRVAILAKYPDAFDLSNGSGTATNGGFNWNKSLKANDRPLSDATIYEKLNADGDRSALACGLIRQMAQRGYTPQQVFDKLSCYSSLPVMGHYRDNASGFDAALRADSVRVFTKPMEPTAQSAAEVIRANVWETTVGRPARRKIKLIGDYLPSAVDAAEKALIEQEAGLFQRGDFIVRPGAAPIAIRGGAQIDGERLYEIRPNELREHMTACAEFQRYYERNEMWKPTNCPEDVARSYSERRGRWKLRPLTGTITAPTLRADGSLLDQPGYDQATGLLCIRTPGADFPAILDMPTMADALAAIDVLKGLLWTFPFETDADRSVALSAILTAVVRRTLKTAPMHGFSAPRRGSGKGKLADIASVIATGREASAIVQGRTEEETEKRLGAVLLSGDAVILLDNCTLPLEGDFLCAMLTAETVKPRILGKSEAPTLPANVVLLATGNNLAAKGDMTRRVLRCTIDPKMEFPEQREFANEPVEDAKRDRLRYLAAALTMLRAYIVAGRPKLSVPLGSFEQWNMIRDALIWLDEADPCDTRTAIEADDPDKEKLAALLQHWFDLVGTARVSTKELIERAMPVASTGGGAAGSGLHEALRTVAPATKDEGAVSADRLGKYLSRNSKVVVGDKRLVPDGTRAGGKLWRLEVVQV
jgi:hypothetical protein